MNRMKLTRKELRKILLVQWSRFQAVPILIKGSTLFTGVNGSGKSTILDALSYAYTGNTQFNKAAQDRDRTVLSYVRGDTKSKGVDQYLREGKVISYIVLEFYSPVDDKYITGGVCIESPDESNYKPFWFIKADAQIDDFNFYSIDGTTMSVTPKNDLRVKGEKMRSADFFGKDKGTTAILRMLGLKNTDITELRRKLNKMMSFQLENNINKFIMQSVLPESPIKTIDNLKEQKAQFEKLKEMYDNIKRRQELLDEIEEKTLTYEQKQYELDMKQTLMYYQQMCIAKSDLEKAEKEIEAEKANAERLKASLSKLESELKAADTAKQNAYMNYKNNDLAKGIEALEARQNSREDRIKCLKRDLELIIKIRNKIMSVYDVCSDNADMKKIIERFDCGEYSAKDKNAAFGFIGKAIRDKTEGFNRERWSLEQEKEKFDEDIEKTAEAIRNLESRKQDFPTEIVRTRDTINKELESAGIDARVRILAELIEDITMPEWRDALEVYLKNHKFDLIIDDEYVDKAMRIFHMHKFKKAQLVVSDKIKDPKVEENSAAGVLVIPNKTARKYVDYLLGRLYLCNTLDELHEHPLGGIMTDGTLAKGYTMRSMDMSRIDYYIGRDAIKLQLENKKKDLECLKERAGKVKTDMRIIENQKEKLDSISLENLTLNFDAVSELPQLEKDHASDKLRIEEMKNNPALQELSIIHDRAVSEYNRIYCEYTEKDRALAVCLNTINTNDLKELIERAENTRSEYDSFILMHLELKKLISEQYEKLVKQRPDGYVITQKTVDNVKGERNALQGEMESAQIKFNTFAGWDPEQRGVSFIPKFREERTLLVNVEAENVKNKLEEKRKVLENAFVTDFIAELCEKVNGSQEQISAINKELKDIPFGQDIYAFKPKERADKSSFFRIKNKIYGQNFGLDQGYVERMEQDPELKQDIDDFMDMILDDDNDEEYTDYRYYYNYDMNITKTIGGHSTQADLSEKQGSASNGEKQTPYYIILAASLMQCYLKDAACARLAFIDEAFAALSQDRIEQMVKYLEQNGFQVMYAAPPEKINSIGSYIDSTVSLVEIGKYVDVVEGLIDEFIEE